jgi:hypothetical protein
MRAALILLCLPLTACGGPPEACTDTTAAYAGVQPMVSAELAFPDTAAFPAQGEVRVTPVNDCEFLAAGYVDSQNAAGGAVRSFYQARIRYDVAGDRYDRITLRFGVF